MGREFPNRGIDAPKILGVCSEICRRPIIGGNECSQEGFGRVLGGIFRVRMGLEYVLQVLLTQHDIRFGMRRFQILRLIIDGRLSVVRPLDHWFFFLGISESGIDRKGWLCSSVF